MVCTVQDALVGNDKMLKRLKPYMEDPNLNVENVSMYEVHLRFCFCSLQDPVDIFKCLFLDPESVKSSYRFHALGQGYL